MRPVTLDLDGFMSYRSKARVDLNTADYFVLVGPTGSGKSTVIDAIVFALYGSVPRWGNLKVVAPALAPTATRGSVKLVFDLAGQRYVVARELRRSASGQVTSNARLDRLTDTAASGTPSDDATSLAADGKVTEAVTQLLGMDFRQFCTCVVLPQGDFDRFLKAAPAERQKILTRLLGLDVYEHIRQAVGEIARDAKLTAETLDGSLTAYLDATPESVEEARAAADLAETLAETVTDQAVRYRDTSARKAAAEATVSARTGDREELLNVSIPDDASALADAHIGADKEKVKAERAHAATVAAVDKARRALEALPARSHLEQTAATHVQLAADRNALPGLTATAQAAAEAAMRLGSAAIAAEEVASEARDVESAARTALETAATSARDIDDQLEVITTVVLPSGLDEAAAIAAASEQALTEAEDVLAQATEAETTAEQAAQEAGEPSTWADVVESINQLAAALEAASSLAEQLAAARQADEEATRAHQDAVAALADADAARAEAIVTDAAVTLREHLVHGQPCPVCDQEVTHLPKPKKASAAARAERAYTAASKTADGARAAADRAARRLDRLEDQQAAIRKTIAELEEWLNGWSPADVDSAVAALSAAEAAAAAHQRQAREAVKARRDTDAAVKARDKAQRKLAVELAQLRRARDPLVALGAPDLDEDDPTKARDTLVAWTQSAARELKARMKQYRKAEAAARASLKGASRQREAAGKALAAAQKEATDAARADASAANDLHALAARISDAEQALTGEPTAAAVTAALKKVTTAEQKLNQAVSAERSARAEAEDARTAATRTGQALDQAWQELRENRDQIARLGPPKITDGDLPQMWNRLFVWARQTATELTRRIDVESAVAAEAAAEATTIAAAIGRELDEAGLSLPEGADLGEGAARAATAHAARSRSEAQSLARRAEDAADLLLRKQQALTTAHVASSLEQQLRADRFPRWLLGSALDLLVADASAHLLTLSGGQFDLTHDDGAFFIIDHADAESRRDVSTLSGGETFQASLALALALSQHVTTMADRTAAALDSLFLDEGFGTLDEGALDTVASTLEQLSASSDRMVGIVTHVKALAERVPVRFVVARDQHGSRVTLETA